MSPGDAEDDNTSSHTIKKHQLDRGVIQEGGVQVEMFSQQSRQNAGEGRGADDHGMSNNFSDDAVQSDQEAYGCEGILECVINDLVPTRYGAKVRRRRATSRADVTSGGA